MTAPRIVVLDGFTLNPGDLSWAPLGALGRLTVFERSTPRELLSRAAGAELLITNKAVIDRGAIEALPELRYIGVTATGTNVVDREAARAGCGGEQRAELRRRLGGRAHAEPDAGGRQTPLAAPRCRARGGLGTP